MLYWEGGVPDGTLSLHDGCCFVFGGDAFDKGGPSFSHPPSAPPRLARSCGAVLHVVHVGLDCTPHHTKLGGAGTKHVMGMTIHEALHERRTLCI